jgi:hypothetical protein
MAGTQYTLRVNNNSTNMVDMCTFQKDPNIGVPNVMSLAWFAKTAWPSTNLAFRWTIDYSFSWSETGELKPGVYFDASQTWPADPSVDGVSTDRSGGNQIGFSHESNAYRFTSTPTPGAQTGSLYIKQDAKIPLKQASVGIGMAGSGTFAVQSQPNLNLTFTPHPKYFLAAGTFTQGEVLDVGSITNPVEIRFPANVFSMTATLNEDNTWTVVPSVKENALLHKQVITDQRRKLTLAGRASR